MRAAAPAVIRLKGALHGVFRFVWAAGALQRSCDRDEPDNSSHAVQSVSTRECASELTQKAALA